MSDKNKNYICKKLIEISTRNCNDDKKILEIPNQTIIFESSLLNSLHTIATRDLACLKSLDMLNTCCKNHIAITYKQQ